MGVEVEKEVVMGVGPASNASGPTRPVTTTAVDTAPEASDTHVATPSFLPAPCTAAAVRAPPLPRPTMGTATVAATGAAATASPPVAPPFACLDTAPVAAYRGVLVPGLAAAPCGWGSHYTQGRVSTLGDHRT